MRINLTQLAWLILNGAVLFLAACQDSHSGSNGADPLAQIEHQLDALPSPRPPDPPLDNWYPQDISPPPGTNYPCALTALPPTLSGIPSSDRNYINHVYSMILRLTQAKLILLRNLDANSEVGRALSAYESTNRKVYDVITAEATPAGLETFHDALLRALDLHLEWAREATQLISRGGSIRETMRISTGKAASAELHTAWKEMRHRYPKMDREMRSSIEHHLCALDLF